VFNKIRDYVMCKTAAVGVIVSGLFVAGAASAQTGSLAGLSSVLTGLDSADAITAIVGAGTVLVGIGFAIWATRRVGKFFG